MKAFLDSDQLQASFFEMTWDMTAAAGFKAGGTTYEQLLSSPKKASMQAASPADLGKLVVPVSKRKEIEPMG